MAPSPAMARPARALGLLAAHRSRTLGRSTDNRALLDRWHRDRDRTAHDELVKRYLPLARKLANSYPAAGERDDLMQVATLGLLDSLERYDPDRGAAFPSFAIPTILGHLRRYIRDYGWAVRVPRQVQELAVRCGQARDELSAELGRFPTVHELAAACDTSAECILEASATASAHFAVSLNQPSGQDEEGPLARLSCEDPGLAEVEAALTLRHLLEPLFPVERAILRLRFEDELTQAEIGAVVGLSQMQVSRIIRRCLVQLAAELRPDRTPSPHSRSPESIAA
jgi:RNA polymerase sigma-B factor